MDRVAASHAIFVILLIALAGIQVDRRVITAMRADNGLGDEIAHDNLQAFAGTSVVHFRFYLRVVRKLGAG